jgi:hypothetical protein
MGGTLNTQNSKILSKPFSASNTGSTDTGIPVLPAFLMIPKYRNTGGSIPVFFGIEYIKYFRELFPIWIKILGFLKMILLCY